MAMKEFWMFTEEREERRERNRRLEAEAQQLLAARSEAQRALAVWSEQGRRQAHAREAERCLSVADGSEGPVRLEWLAMARAHLADAGSKSYAKAIANLIARESRAALDNTGLVPLDAVERVAPKNGKPGRCCEHRSGRGGPD
jgi:hypothetical protein